jgi:hypothetical protein
MVQWRIVCCRASTHSSWANDTRNLRKPRFDVMSAQGLAVACRQDHQASDARLNPSRRGYPPAEAIRPRFAGGSAVVRPPANWLEREQPPKPMLLTVHKARETAYNMGVSKEARRTPMRWFRSHRLKVVSLALFALVCQFVLSFGHVHLDRFAGNSSNWLIAATAGSGVAASAGKVTIADLPTSPLQKSPTGLGDDFCAICANIGLALVIPTGPALLPGILLFKELHWSFAATQARSIDHFHFNARGPPTV